MKKPINLILYLIIWSVFISCNTDSTPEIDPRMLRDLQIIKQENPDYILDSLDLEYTIDAQKLMYIDDIYQDSTGFHIILSDFDTYVADLLCSAEQIAYIKNADFEYSARYIIMVPDHIKKMDFNFVATDDGAMGIESDFVPFKITGRLITIRKKE